MTRDISRCEATPVIVIHEVRIRLTSGSNQVGIVAFPIAAILDVRFVVSATDLPTNETMLLPNADARVARARVRLADQCAFHSIVSKFCYGLTSRSKGVAIEAISEKQAVGVVIVNWWKRPGTLDPAARHVAFPSAVLVAYGSTRSIISVGNLDGANRPRIWRIARARIFVVAIIRN